MASYTTPRDTTGISRSSIYFRHKTSDASTLDLLRRIDEQYLKTPFYGSRKMMIWLRELGYAVGRDRVRRLMRLLGLEAICQKPRTTKPATGHKIYPYLLRDLVIDRPNQVPLSPKALLSSAGQGV